MGKGYNNYMCKKPFHPGSKANIKRAWMAEQKTKNENRKQEELKVQYEKEQDLYNNRALISSESKDKLELNFMYEAPPGAKREHQKEDDEPEYKFEWQRKYNAPREDYAKGNTDIRDQPFGIPVRNVRCIKCHKWGHINTDRECPLFSQASTSSMPTTSMDPMELMKQMREEGYGLKENVLGHRMNPKAANQQYVASDIESDPEAEFLNSLSMADKKKLLRKLKKLSKKQEKMSQKKKKSKKTEKRKSKYLSHSDSESGKRTKKKCKKKVKESSGSGSSSSSDGSEGEIDKKASKHVKHRSERTKSSIMKQRFHKSSKTSQKNKDCNEDVSKYRLRNPRGKSGAKIKQEKIGKYECDSEPDVGIVKCSWKSSSSSSSEDETVVKKPVKPETEQDSKRKLASDGETVVKKLAKLNTGHHSKREQVSEEETMVKKLVKPKILHDSKHRLAFENETMVKEVAKPKMQHDSECKNVSDKEFSKKGKGQSIEADEKTQTDQKEYANVKHPDGFSHLCPQAVVKANYGESFKEYVGGMHDNFRQFHRLTRSPSVKQKYNK